MEKTEIRLEARASTRDIDAIFHPARELREMIGTVAARHGLPADWLNDGVKGFVSDKGVQDYRLYEEMSHLRFFSAAPEYLLAMKCISLRLGDSHDENDVRFLLDRLGINEVERAFGIVEKYYQRDRIPPKTQFALQELIARRRSAESGPATGGG